MPNPTIQRDTGADYITPVSYSNVEHAGGLWDIEISRKYIAVCRVSDDSYPPGNSSKRHDLSILSAGGRLTADVRIAGTPHWRELDSVTTDVLYWAAYLPLVEKVTKE